MKTRNLIASAAALVGMVGGGFYHQAQAIDTCAPGSGDMCDELIASAQAVAPNIIPDDTRDLLWQTINDVRTVPYLVVLPEPLAAQEQFLMSSINGAIAPFQPTVIGTTTYALRSTTDTINTATDAIPGGEDESCVEKHTGHGGNGHGKDKHCKE